MRKCLKETKQFQIRLEDDYKNIPLALPIKFGSIRATP